MIKEVYLDLDDTLNSLTLHILRSVFGVEIGIHDYDKYPEGIGYNIVGGLERLTGRKIPESEFWKMMPREVWSQTPISPQFYWLLDISRDLVGEGNVYILTKPTDCPECYAGKAIWMQNFLPPWLRGKHFIGADKFRLAAPDTLLVDDSDFNINTFREKGGNAVLIPRPWNSLHGKDTDLHLAREFYPYFSELIG